MFFGHSVIRTTIFFFFLFNLDKANKINSNKYISDVVISTAAIIITMKMILKIFIMKLNSRKHLAFLTRKKKNNKRHRHNN